MLFLGFEKRWSVPNARALVLAFGKGNGGGGTVSGQARLRLGAPQVKGQGVYDNRVDRWVTGWQGGGWQVGNSNMAFVREGMGSTQRLEEYDRVGWGRGRFVESETRMGNGIYLSARSSSSLGWKRLKPLSEVTLVGIGNLRATDIEGRLVWETLGRSSLPFGSPFVSLVPLPHGLGVAWDEGVLKTRVWQTSAGVGRAAWRTMELPWQIGRLSPLGQSPPFTEPPEPPAIITYRNPVLRFRCPVKQLQSARALPLNFSRLPCQGRRLIPLLQVYHLMHQVSLVRLPDREPLPLKSLSVTVDRDSWTWGFTANLPYSALSLVEPTATGPRDVEVNINGNLWVMLVENLEVRRAFGQSSLSIRGRSRAAYLAEPYAPKRSFTPNAPFTARQLAEDALNRIDRVTGFTLDWQLPDWLVPAGSWSYESLTPMGVIGRIAASVGGWVVAHRTADTLIAKSRYPHMPWEWANVSPDVTLPLDVVSNLSLQWQEKPQFNAVFVSGERTGVLARVIRSGTAGDSLAPSVVDSLITHADAARERGRSILADVGKQALITLELPLFEELGVVEPGLLMAVNEGATRWHGLVRATTLNAEWNNALTVRQTLELERHYLN